MYLISNLKISLNTIRKERVKRMCERDLKTRKEKGHHWVEYKHNVIEDISSKVFDVLIEDCVLFLVSQENP